LQKREPKQLKKPGRAQKRTLWDRAEGAWAAGCKPSGVEAPTGGALQV
jgi:hypothetical protein